MWDSLRKGRAGGICSVSDDRLLIYKVREGSNPKTHPTLFHTIPIGIWGFLEFLWLGSEGGQRISRGDYCVICVESCENSRETWVSPWLMTYLRRSRVDEWREKGYLIFKNVSLRCLGRDVLFWSLKCATEVRLPFPSILKSVVCPVITFLW